MKINKPSPILFITIFAIGAFVGLALAVIAIWSDLEASFYGFDRRASTPLNGLSCPIFLTRDEMGVVSLKISNTTEKPLSPSIRTEISTPVLPDSFLESIRLAPGESRKLEWDIGSKNIDLGYFIFAKVLVYASYPMPDREAACGTFIINLPVSGSAFLIVMVTLSMISMGGGLYMLNKTKQLQSRAAMLLRPLTFLAGVIMLVLLVSFMGWWIQGIVILVIAILTMVGMLNFLILREK